MDKFIINGGNKLYGECDITSSKNAILPIIACSLMCSGDIIINKCPRLEDVKNMAKILTKFNCKAQFTKDKLIINCDNAEFNELTNDYTHKIRSSIFILGPLLSKFHKAKISYPGGCDIGLRPIDLHILGLKQLNVDILDDEGMLFCDGANMKNGKVYLDFPSVGATENVIMASVLSKGITTIRNCAREPEIVDLANFINAMGGKVEGAGNDTIVVEGVSALHGGMYTPIPDRIVQGTMMGAVAMCGGEVLLHNCQNQNIISINQAFMRMGCNIRQKDNSLIMKVDKRLSCLHKLETQPFPGFPTDMQPIITAVLAKAKGASMVVENLFENRFKFTSQLAKMGANIIVKDRIALIKGVSKLKGNIVYAQDLRGGAALTIAGASSQGVSEINDINHIDRGYYHIENMLSSLGCDIKRIKN